MPWLDAAAPLRMRRIALVAPDESLRDVLVRVADAGAVEIDQAGHEQGLPGEAARRLQHAGPPAAGRVLAAGASAPRPLGSGGPGLPVAGRVLAAGASASRPLPSGKARLSIAVPGPALAAEAPDLDQLELTGRYDLLAGEAQLEAYAAAAVRQPGAAALAGWIPADRLPGIAARVAEAGGAVVPLPHPPGVQAPTLLGGPAIRRSLTPLVQTYGTVPYADIDPTWLAWASYVLMFGMMFGDVGQGLLLVAVAAGLRAGWPRWARRFRRAWPFVGGAGVAATGFGALYGECFGPTGLIPTVWLNPLSSPVTLLLVAVGIGAALLAGAYALGVVNRWREGGWPAALYAPSGIAGTALFLGAGIIAGGWYLHRGPLIGAGGFVALAGLALAFVGFLADAGGGGTGVVQASVELFDLVVRLGSNVVSFSRLAAFGLTHAALGLVVWEGARALWHRGGALAVAGVAVFAAGSALAFSLEALVAAIQALRLEYYELFSRIFVTQGRPFRPWRLPVVTGHETSVMNDVDGLNAKEGAPCPPG